jgi:hypothetical protein
MKYSIVHYLRNLPWAYYLRGGLIRPQDPTLTIYLSRDASAILISRRRLHLGYETKISELPDAPPLPGGHNQWTEVGRSFSAKLLARSRVQGAPQFWLLPDLDSSELYCTIHRAGNLRESTSEDLLESLAEEPKQVIGSWDDVRPFRWAIFSSSLKAVTGKLDQAGPQIMIVGLPVDYCEQVEDWVERQNGSLLGILPVPIAVLSWLLRSVPTDKQTIFLLLVLSGSTVLVVIQRGEVLLLKQLAEAGEHLARETAELARELRLSAPPLYVWSATDVSSELVRSLEGTELAGPVLDQIAGSKVQFRRNGARKKNSTDDQVAHLLQWVCHENV